MRRLTFLLLAATPALGFGQSRSSFTQVYDLQGVNVERSTNGLAYKLALGSNATYELGNNTYIVKRIFGFWVLKDENPDNLNPVHSDFGVWDKHTNNSGTGSIAGWKANPNTGINPNQNVTFNFESLNSNEVDRYGFHVLVTQMGHDKDFTLYITGEPIPEPASLAALGIGALAFLRRRRK